MRTWTKTVLSSTLTGAVTATLLTAVPAAAQDEGANVADLPVSASELLMINAGLTTAGRAPLPTDTVALRDSGESFAAVTSAGSLVERTAEDEPATAARGVIPKKIKEVVAACLGVSVAATGFWAAIVEQLTSWKKAVKFVVRRLGVVGAVSCMGGIVWKYL